MMPFTYLDFVTPSQLQNTAIIVKSDLTIRIEDWYYNSTFFHWRPIQDIVVKESDTKPVITPTYLYFWISKNAVILILYHNSKGWIRAYGFALFIFSKSHFSGIRFDTRFKNEIRYRYPYRIWNFSNFWILSITTWRILTLWPKFQIWPPFASGDNILNIFSHIFSFFFTISHPSNGQIHPIHLISLIFWNLLILLAYQLLLILCVRSGCRR